MFVEAPRVDHGDVEELKDSDRMLIESGRTQQAEGDDRLPQAQKDDGESRAKRKNAHHGDDSASSTASLGRFLGSLSPAFTKAGDTVLSKLTGLLDDNESHVRSEGEDKREVESKPEPQRAVAKPKTEDELLEEHLAAKLLEAKSSAKLEKKEEFGKAQRTEGKHKTLQAM